MLKSRITARVILRNISSLPKPWIGKKFSSIDDAKDFMKKETWSIEEYLKGTSKRSDVEISDETITKLLKLSGLPSESVDIISIKKRLKGQLLFINKLQETPYETEQIDEKNARILPRFGKPLTYDELMNSIDTQEKNIHSGEVSKSWNPTKMAKISKNEMYVVRGGLMKDRM